MNYDAIRAAMQREIDNPRKCYLPNSSEAVVRDSLFQDMLWEEAAYFWSAVCRHGFNIPDMDAMLQELSALNQDMPDWGTRGT